MFYILCYISGQGTARKGKPLSRHSNTTQLLLRHNPVTTQFSSVQTSLSHSSDLIQTLLGHHPEISTFEREFFLFAPPSVVRRLRHPHNLGGEGKGEVRDAAYAAESPKRLSGRPVS